MENNTIPAPGAAQVSSIIGASANVCASTAVRAQRLPHELAVAAADFTVYTCVYISTALIVLLLVGIIGYVLAQGWPALNLEFFTCSTSLRKGTIGVDRKSVV